MQAGGPFISDSSICPGVVQTWRNWDLSRMTMHELYTQFGLDVQVRCWADWPVAHCASCARVAKRRLQPCGRHRTCGCAGALFPARSCAQRLTLHGPHPPACRPLTLWATPLRCIRMTPT